MLVEALRSGSSVSGVSLFHPGDDSQPYQLIAALLRRSGAGLACTRSPRLRAERLRHISLLGDPMPAGTGRARLDTALGTTRHESRLESAIRAMSGRLRLAYRLLRLKQARGADRGTQRTMNACAGGARGLPFMDGALRSLLWRPRRVATLTRSGAAGSPIAPPKRRPLS